MSLNMAAMTAANGIEVLSPRTNEAGSTAKVTRKSFVRRIADKMAADAQRRAFARLAATNPRMAADLHAAWIRAVEDANN